MTNKHAFYGALALAVVIFSFACVAFCAGVVFQGACLTIIAVSLLFSALSFYDVVVRNDPDGK